MGDKDLGFVGLGIMGKPMAKNLINAGYSVTVYDISATSIEEMATYGASPASSAREVAEKAPVVITMVPDSSDSETAILGPNGVLEGASEGDTVIDMSSIAPATSQKIAALCEAQSVDFLDAPVSGGEPKAIDGTLAVMVGGKSSVFDKYENLINVMASSVVLCGNYGAGNTTKLANQIIVAANIEALAEALVLSKKAGLDPNVVFEAIRGGLAGSTVMEAKAPMMIAGDFNPGFRIRLHQKDLHNALLTGKDLGVPLPVTSIVQQMLGALINGGKADSDHSAIANFLEDMAQSKISGS
ncbi:MAG: 2-hydroxy-3-oxopropionate reductase [SAR202 cluster bacterium]|jgi:2-hydroxy-3-oxopropionate reductase|nr:2-hydroxy-3-oxopropionate reductase [SAR202 cluster bacterium]